MMPTHPFPSIGSARDREEALFEFLAEQALGPELQVWQHFADMSGRRADLGHCALILHNLTEHRVPPEVSLRLYEIAESLLEKPDIDTYTNWLRQGLIDVPRLAGYLDQVLRR